MMTRRSRPYEDHADQQIPMLGVLSVLLLLIPSLMLLAQVTRYAEVTVSAPRFSTEGPPSHTTFCGGVPPLEIAIAHDGFYTRTTQRQWTRAGAPVGGHDHAALAATVREFKQAYPSEVVAVVSAQSDISYATLVATLDTIRGRGCQLSETWSGEQAPDECLLWHPIIRDRRSDHTVPGFRGGQTWPPRPPQNLSIRDGQSPVAG